MCLELAVRVWHGRGVTCLLEVFVPLQSHTQLQWAMNEGWYADVRRWLDRSDESWACALVPSWPDLGLPAGYSVLHFAAIRSPRDLPDNAAELFQDLCQRVLEGKQLKPT